jgi:hypothetical protein
MRAEVSSEWRGFLFFWSLRAIVLVLHLTISETRVLSISFIFLLSSAIIHDRPFTLRSFLSVGLFFPTYYLLFLLCYGFDHRWALSARRYSICGPFWFILSGVIEIRQGLVGAG